MMQSDVIMQAARVASTLESGYSSDEKPYIAELKRSIKETDKQLHGISSYIAANGADAPTTLLMDMEQLEHRKLDLQDQLQHMQKHQQKIDGRKIIRAIKRAADAVNRPQIEQKVAIQQAVRRVIVTNDQYRVIFSDCTFSGGGEGNRTPVRRFKHMVFSERSLSF
jgi:hypothetical protein